MPCMLNKKRVLALAACLGAVLILGSLSFLILYNGTESEPGSVAEPSGPKSAPPARAADSLYPLLGNAGYDVLRYELELDVSLAENSISATASITARATENLETFKLDLAGLEVHSATIDDARAAFSRSEHKLVVAPAEPLLAGSQFEAEILYSGSPELIADPSISFSELGWHHRDNVIYTINQPSGSMAWFPSNNHPADKATYEISITVAENITAASNGILVDQITADGKTTYIWQMDEPMATYLAAVYIGDFERIDHGRAYEDGPLLRDYLPRNSHPSIKQALSVTPEIIRFFEDRLGPYPFDAYGTIVMPFELGFAMENQTLSLHGLDTLGADVIAHEIAHQWLGNSASLEDWSDIWLNEGFATYLHLMFEAEYLELNLNAQMDQIYALLSENKAGPLKGVRPEGLLSFEVYIRGAASLHALRLHAGDETFFKILRTHYVRAAGANTNTDRFLGIVDELAGPEAVALVESWLFDEVPPAPATN